MSLILLLNPKQYGGVIETVDTSDILDVYRRKRRQNELLEEELALQLLKARQTDLVIPDNVNENKLSNILKTKLETKPLKDEVVGKERIKRIKILLLLLAMDE